MLTRDDLHGRAGAILNAVDGFFEKYALAERLSADHIGYRCASHEEFVALRAMLENESEFMYQSIVSGRPIAIIKLKEGFATKSGKINFLELADQKPDGSQKSGFDHIEFFPKQGTMEMIVEFTGAQGLVLEKADRPHHVTYDTVLPEGFKFRVEAEALMDKIVREEIK